MPALRFISGIFLLAAVVTLVADASGWLAGVAPFTTKSVLAHWAELSPRSLAGLRAGIAPLVWDTVLAPLLDLPTAVVLFALAALLGWIGRRRRRVNVFAN